MGSKADAGGSHAAAHTGSNVVVGAGETPSMLGPYRIEGVIGYGGMATVYRAVQPDLERVVAIKVLLPRLASDPVFRQRFEQEGRLMASLRHPNIVAVYDVGEERDQPYLVMEYLDGPTLSALIRQRQQAGAVFSPAETLALLRPLCNALDYAHDRQIVHRDLKPENIICTTQGPVITDFGVAKLLQEEAAEMSIVMGTPAYMAPEQITSAPIDRRTDVYALGVLLYEMATGHVPFSGSTPSAVTEAHLQQPPPAFTALNPRVHAPELEKVARRALAKRPAERWSSAGALLAALVDAAGADTPTAAYRAASRTVPARPHGGKDRWSRFALLIPLILLFVGGFVVMRVLGGISGDAIGTPEAASAVVLGDRTETSTAVATALLPTVVPVLTVEPAPEASSPTLTATSDGLVRGRVVAASGAYLRAGPGSNYPIIAGLADGVALTARQRSDGWLDVEAETGEQGWIAESLVETDGLVAALPTAPPVPTVVPPTPTLVVVAAPTVPVEVPTAVVAVPTEPVEVPTQAAPPPPQTGGSLTLEDTDFTGGFRNSGGSVYGGRTSTWVYGQGTGYERMSASFQLDGTRTGSATLVIEGMDSEDRAKTPIVIAINDTVLFQGESPFPNDDMPLASGVWGSLPLSFDAALLRPGTNTISITNLALGRRGLPPFVAVDYAVLQLP